MILSNYIHKHVSLAAAANNTNINYDFIVLFFNHMFNSDFSIVGFMKYIQFEYNTPSLQHKSYFRIFTGPGSTIQVHRWLSNSN